MTSTPEPSPTFRLNSSAVRAEAQLRDGQFTVLAGSQARSVGAAFTSPETTALIQGLVDAGQLVASTSAEHLTFTADVVFNSASEATNVILRNSDVTSSMWYVTAEDGQELTLGEWQQRLKTEIPTFILTAGALEARAQMRSGRFVVLAGSQARADAVSSFVNGYARQRETLIRDGQLPLGEGGAFRVYQQDVAFDGGTAAAAVTLGRNASGFKEWFYVTPQGTRESYATWWSAQGNRLLKGGGQEVIGAVWRPFLRAVVAKVAGYEDRQPELLQLLRDAGLELQYDKGEPSRMLDPFSFLALILRRQADHLTAELLRFLKTALGLNEEVPTDFTGLPRTEPVYAWYFSRKSADVEGDVAVLWALARQAVAGQLEEGTFEQALAVRKVGLSKLTLGLFWLSPEAYLPLTSGMVSYLGGYGVRDAGKVSTLPQLDQVMAAARQLHPDFPTLVHLASAAVQENGGVATLDGAAFPFTQFREEASRYAADIPKGNVTLDRRYAPLLLSVMNDSAFTALRPSRSPYSGKSQLAVKVGLGSGPGGQAAPFARTLLIPLNLYADHQPVPPGLTLEVGLPDGRGDGPREALRDASMMNELLELALAVPEGMNEAVFTLSSDFPEVGLLPLGVDALPALQDALDAYVTGSGKNRHLRIGVTLSPEQLESSGFPDLLQVALEYVDDLADLLGRAVRLAETSSRGSTSTGTADPVSPAASTFVPVPGVPLNQILYGPPGTGKTYRVVDEALAVLDPAFLSAHAGPDGRPARKARYDALVAEGQVSFVTFHQSFGYEDFVEGIKPVMSEGQLSYVLQDGVFLGAVRAAGGNFPGMVGGDAASSLQTVRPEAQVWRMYIDKTIPVSPIRDRSLARGELRMGNWGRTPKDLTDLSVEDLSGRQLLFRDSVRVGDLVLLATGIDRIGAVGVVTGEYRFDPHSEAIFAADYTHVRTVRWLAQDLDLSAQQVTGKQFSPPALQRVADVRPDEILAKMGLTVPPVPAQGLRPHVLIIDEINRGNVAKIFGELITLLESGKRAGASEALSATLPLSRRSLSVPQSLYLIGTMNTADRSLSLLDSALRRRFSFRPVWPQPEVLPVLEFEDGTALDLRKFLFAINARIERLLSREQVIGHAYLLDLPEPARLEDVALALRERIMPLLEEYFFEDWGKIREVLGDDKKGQDESLQFVLRHSMNGDVRYSANPDAYASVEAFTLVYSQLEDSVFNFSR